MWAMIPMFRTRSSGMLSSAPVALEGCVSAITTCTSLCAAHLWSACRTRGSLRSPLVMGERLVGLCHLVRLFLAAYGGSGVVHRVEQLALELLGHRLARALARGLDDPAHR